MNKNTSIFVRASICQLWTTLNYDEEKNLLADNAEWYVITSSVQDSTILSYNLQKINTYKRGSPNSPLIPDER